MAAGDGHAVLHPHELGKHLRPGDYRYAVLPGGYHLRIIRGHGRRDHHDVGPGEVALPVAQVKLSAQFHQPLHRFPFHQIGTADPVAHVEQNFRDAAHSDAADSDEVYMLSVSEHPLSH